MTRTSKTKPKTKRSTVFAWLDEVEKELGKITTEDLIDPGDEIEDGDHLVGEASDEQRKLYTLMRKYADEVNEKSPPRTDLKANLIREIFWFSIVEFFGLWDKSNAQIRKGWKVVWRDEEEEQKPYIPTIILVGPGIPFNPHKIFG